jgi:hypothetical protein
MNLVIFTVNHMGILDTIIDTQQQKTREHFEPAVIVSKILAQLKEREKHILSKRYGLLGNEVETLETIGKFQGLTRERVRQIEKDVLRQLKHEFSNDELIALSRDLLVNTISEHGGIMAEENLLDFLSASDAEDKNAVKFILNLVAEVEPLKGEKDIKESWINLTFDKGALRNFIEEAKKMLQEHTKPLHTDDFLIRFKGSEFYLKNHSGMSDKVLINYLNTATEIRKNPFGEYGLHFWSEIRPKDVGDKAYLVMKHHKKPEHYSIITELINKHNLDERKAYKETVHNELIKDKRFILVGRGIYALAEWGYKPGVVSDVIVGILKEAKAPLTRDQIVGKVLEKRLVKKNTILVGLSNKRLFKKVSKNLYALAENA